MSSDSHRQQVALTVAVQVVVHQPHDRLPSVFRDWRQNEWESARLHQDAKRSANCLSQETVSSTSDTGIVETVTMIHWRKRRVCRVCVSCRKFDDSTLAARRKMWSKLAKDRFSRLPRESRKPQAQPLTTAFIIFSDIPSNAFCLQLDTLSGCAK